MDTKKIAGTAIFAALTIVFTLISNYVAIAGVSINLAMLPIALAGILFGPWSAAIVGLINGGFVLLAPATGSFFAINAWATVVVCLVKSSLAGFIGGLIFLPFKKTKHYITGNIENYKLSPKAASKQHKYLLVGTILVSLLVPFLNTSLFIVGCLLFFNGAFGSLVSLFISVNFIIEISCCGIIAPIISNIVIKKGLISQS